MSTEESFAASINFGMPRRVGKLSEGWDLKGGNCLNGLLVVLGEG
jgi:hypothetical protein